MFHNSYYVGVTVKHDALGVLAVYAKGNENIDDICALLRGEPTLRKLNDMEGGCEVASSLNGIKTPLNLSNSFRLNNISYILEAPLSHYPVLSRMRQQILEAIQPDRLAIFPKTYPLASDQTIELHTLLEKVALEMSHITMPLRNEGDQYESTGLHLLRRNQVSPIIPSDRVRSGELDVVVSYVPELLQMYNSDDLAKAAPLILSLCGSQLTRLSIILTCVGLFVLDAHGKSNELLLTACFVVSMVKKQPDITQDNLVSIRDEFLLFLYQREILESFTVASINERIRMNS